MRRILAGAVAVAALLGGPAHARQAQTPPSTLAQACEGKDGWNDPAPPAHLFGNVYYVGTCGITSLLVTSQQGHVLLDGAASKAGPLIARNIQALGFKLGDVKTILNSHEHGDHAAGIAYLQRVTGATVLVREPAIATFERGHSDREDPQLLELPEFPPVAHVRAVANGETVKVGMLALTAHATPGHAPGGTSWSWRSCEGTRCLAFAYADSVSAISDKVYRFTEHPDYVAAFRTGLDTIAGLHCDVLLTPHPGASDLFERIAGRAPLVDADACERYADTGRGNLDARLRAERDGTAP